MPDLSRTVPWLRPALRARGPYLTVTDTVAVVGTGGGLDPRVSRMAATIPPTTAAPPPTPSAHQPHLERLFRGASSSVSSGLL
jgi:hypothetical protein